jgi:hypothetical protein
LSANGEWESQGGGDTNVDTTVAENTDYTDNADYTLADNSDYGDYDFAKRGGLITMMKNGGLPKYAGGNLVDETGMISDFAINDETGDLYKPLGTNESGDSYVPVLGNQGYVKNSTPTALSDLVKGDSTSNPSVTNVDLTGGTDFTPTPGIQYFDDGSYIQTFDDGSTITVDSDGNIADTTESYQTTRDDAGNFIVTDGYGNMTVYDPSGNIIPLGGGRVNSKPITNVGGGKANTAKDVFKTDAQGNVYKNGVLYRAADVPEEPTGGIGSDLLSTITGALGTTAGAAGAGALIASLLGSDFGGGTGAQNQGVDMSKVGLINPRTTDFGIGPTNFVGYDQYGTDGGDYTPNEELLHNLNAPGYNPVNEGDYGYAPADETELADNSGADTPTMASGGLSSMQNSLPHVGRQGRQQSCLLNQSISVGFLSFPPALHQHQTYRQLVLEVLLVQRLDPNHLVLDLPLFTPVSSHRHRKNYPCHRDILRQKEPFRHRQDERHHHEPCP